MGRDQFEDDHGGATGPGNTGDNFFPEGGDDVVDISANEVGTLTSFEQIISSSGEVLVSAGENFANWSTVWVGFYDVSNSGGPFGIFDPYVGDPSQFQNYGVGQKSGTKRSRASCLPTRGRIALTHSSTATAPLSRMLLIPTLQQTPQR